MTAGWKNIGCISGKTACSSKKTTTRLTTGLFIQKTSTEFAGEGRRYGNNCNVKLTARLRLKPSSNAKTHEGTNTAWPRPTTAPNEVR